MSICDGPLPAYNLKAKVPFVGSMIQVRPLGMLTCALQQLRPFYMYIFPPCSAICLGCSHERRNLNVELLSKA